APLPAELPLPGGRPRATVKLHPILATEFRAPPAWFHREEGRGGTLKSFGVGVAEDDLVDAPIGWFLLEHPLAGRILVDTGLHPSVAVDPKPNFGWVGMRAFRDLSVDAAHTAPAQLRARGVEPREIAVVVMTHLHVDHASAASEFPGATFVVSDREWEAATSARSVLHGYSAAQLDHALDWRTLDFDGEEADSFATFGRALDLFGDGSVRCVHTPGHTHGHMSVVVRLRDREALLAGDAIYTMRTLRESRLPSRCEDWHQFKRSLREIQGYARQTPTALIVPGHDAAAWRSLEPAY
ncbi:MAG: N-acyl homoserine lactonase family protein, partial [Thermoleophilaceae bacterium]|nr:N-acyl homoserine lactonase family protein [Thermoleophilaceae bacterium]